MADTPPQLPPPKKQIGIGAVLLLLALMSAWLFDMSRSNVVTQAMWLLLVLAGLGMIGQGVYRLLRKS
ncbi:hypothetical protein L1281_000259 [Neisseria sp. HSC-16F19]|nr:hypothetical protein [Neisseria sp. HSC-16F19]MCP2039689.1 hypothetical protein [Neisseria sp. HSC-16F19]